MSYHEKTFFWPNVNNKLCSSFSDRQVKAKFYQSLYYLLLDLLLPKAELVSNNLSRIMRKPTFWYPTWSDTNQAVQPHQIARGLKFQIYKVEGLYYLCSEKHRKADLRLCFENVKCWFSHDGAHIRVFTGKLKCRSFTIVVGVG